MLGSIILGPNEELTDLFYRSCTECQNLSVYKILYEYPRLHQLVRLLNAYGPQVAFVEFGKDEGGFDVAREVLINSPATAIVGYTSRTDLEDPPPESGIVEILRPPFSADAIHRAVARALEEREEEHRDNVVAFLPAKAGSGSSTSALNVAGYLARFWEKKVLIIEADLHSGCLAIQLKQNPNLSVVDGLENAESLNERQWGRLVCQAQGVDLLLTTREKKLAMVSPWDYQQLLSFASSRYDCVFVDLPEVVNDATEAIVTRAKKVYVVCTHELPSLFLARRRLHELASRGVEQSRLGLVLNRYAEQFEQVEELEDLLNRKVSVVLPNDYLGVREALLDDGLVGETSPLGRAYLSFAEEVAGTEPVVAPAQEATTSSGESGSMKSFFAQNLRSLLGRTPEKATD